MIGSFMKKSPVLRYVEKKIAQWTQIPVENGESLYVLRYEKGQEYKAHNDWFPPERTPKDSGNRFATVLVYLQSPEEGGDTVFPRTQVRVTPRAGDALLFYNLDTLSHGDTNALHASEPVVSGTKWAMTKWIRQRGAGYWYNYLSEEEKKAVDKEDQEFMKKMQTTSQHGGLSRS